MDLLNGGMLDGIVREAEAQVAEIYAHLERIRDRVAPGIPDRDLALVAVHPDVRERIAPHPTLRRACFAAEAATATLRRVRDCVAAAKILLSGGAGDHDPVVRQSEAHHWTRRAQELGQAVARARAAVAGEAERVRTGKATVFAQPVPAVAGS